jgi:hypothetical protein
MNPITASYFDEIEVRLIESPVVASYKQVHREITPTDGKLLQDGGKVGLKKDGGCGTITTDDMSRR